jgi:hypothetical protein
MTIQSSNKLITHFEEIETAILNGGWSRSWNGIDFQWKSLALKHGGKQKRKGTYGNIHYFYRDDELTREQAIVEISKPVALRQAIIDATTTIECSMCGLVLVGKDASEPYTSIAYDYDRGVMIRKRQWGLVFMRMNDNNEPITLNLCPNCMQRIANGEFREG